MDKILIRKLQVDAIIGIHDYEKQQKQPVWLDMDLSFDCLPAAQSDDIRDALDYFKVCERVSHFVASTRYELIEALAEAVTEVVLNEFACEQIELTLYKPNAVANTETVGIQINRWKQ
ncbi:dihydroneopterin aldolase [Marinicella sediminis]|uniref:7,8-dihydroneopterin aldolase n=1 Tax=Marinicella sediminis TaxID=1792834 RepID=A0ABV7J7K6_9GAMM|nr:dihydroneopterin aldolase [Marinicella sediminis]